MGESKRDGAKGLRHRLRRNHHDDGHAEPRRQIRAAWLAIEQTHHRLDQDEVSVARRVGQYAAAFGFADHPKIERIHGRAGCARENHRIKKVRAGFKDAHAPSLSLVVACKRRSHRGFSLTRRGRADKYCGTSGHDQNSMPGCALICCTRSGCFTSRISVTRSAASIIRSCACRPVSTMCSASGRLLRTASTSSSGRYSYFNTTFNSSSTIIRKFLLAFICWAISQPLRAVATSAARSCVFHV